MTSDQAIQILAAVTLFELMVTIGLGVTLAEIGGVARNWRLVSKAALASYVVFPAAAVGLPMQMIRHVIYGNQLMLLGGDDARDVFLQLVVVFWGDKALPAFNGENDLNVDLGVGVCHRDNPSR